MTENGPEKTMIGDLNGNGDALKKAAARLATKNKPAKENTLPQGEDPNNVVRKKSAKRASRKKKDGRSYMERIADHLKEEGMPAPTPVQAMALHTMSKIPESDFNELNASSGGESNEVFVKKSRELWDKFAVHGFVKFENGKKVLDAKTDLDGRGALKMFELAGFDIKNIASTYPGKHEEGAVTLDASGTVGVSTPDAGKSLILDHHAKFRRKSDKEKPVKEDPQAIIEKLIEQGLLKKGETLRDTSSTKIAYLKLVEAGFLKEDKNIERFVNLVTDEDNEKYTDKEVRELFKDKKNQRPFCQTLIGLSKYLTVDQILEILKEKPEYKNPLANKYLKGIVGRDPISGEEKPLFDFKNGLRRRIDGDEKNIKRMAKAGLEFNSGDSRFGKVLVDTGSFFPIDGGENVGYDQSIKTGFLPARAAGYGAYVVYIKEQNRFKVYTKKPLNDVEFEQGVDVRGHYWTCPAQEDGLDVTLEEILSKLAGKEVKIEGKLKLAIEEEQRKKENLLEETKKYKKRFEELREKMDVANFDEKIYGKENVAKADMLRGELENLLKTNLGMTKGKMQWEQKLKTLNILETTIDKFIRGLSKNEDEAEKEKELSEKDKIYIKDAYLDFVRDCLAEIKNTITPEKGYSEKRLSVTIRKREEKFWETELYEELLEDEKITEEKVHLVIEEIKKQIT